MKIKLSSSTKSVKWRCKYCSCPLGYVPKDNRCPNPFCKGVNEIKSFKR